MRRRLLVVGGEGLPGRELLERLRELDLDEDLELVGTESEFATLASFGGGLRVQAPDLAGLLDEARAVVVCEPPSELQVERLLAAAGSLPLIDLTGVLEGRPIDARRSALPESGTWASPTASALVVASLARAAARAGARGALAATVLEPISELGLPAVEEMHAQAVALLNFQELPAAVLGGQAVHDLRSPGREGLARERRLRREVGGLCEATVSVLRVQSGAFHGVAVALRAALEASAWREALADEPGLVLGAEPAEATPVAAVRSGRAVIGRLDDDGAGGAWAWVAADSLEHGAVGNAARLLGT